MKRFWFLAPPLLAALLWLLGRAPTDYAVGQQCARFQEERRGRERPLREEIERLEADPAGAARLAELRRAYAGSLVAAQERTVRGWSLLIIPEGAPRPEPRDYRVLGRRQVATPDDPPILHGSVEVWIAPKGPLARALSALGLAP